MARITPRLPLLLASATLGLSLTLSAPAQADSAHEARVLYQKGNAAFRKGDSILARDFYEKSLAKHESFDTRCNLGRAQAEDKLFSDAYENLGICVAMYPDDKELADARERFVGLKNDVRGRLSSEDASEIDARVEGRVAVWRAEAEAPASGLGEEESAAEADESPSAEPTTRKNTWKMPVVISLAGAGVVTGVVGGVMFGVAGGHQKEADGLRGSVGPGGCFDGSAPECAELDDKLKKRDASVNAGIGLAVTGGGLLLSSLVVALIVPGEKKAEAGWKSVRPSAVVGGNGMSLGLSGRF